MIKYFFIVINSLTVFIFSLFNSDNGITITSVIPSKITAGKEVVMEIKVNKGNMSGFAKLQLELPEGMAAKESENKGANYTFDSGISKWVWASLPSESEIIIKITLISADDEKGLKTINAKFSFIENNIKQVVEMTPVEITIVPPGVNAPNSETPAATTTETPLANVTTSDSTNKTVSKDIAQVSNSEPPGNITVMRTITKLSATEYVVNLKIKKDGTKGFARYSDDLPDNLTAKAIKTDGSSFSVGDGKLKFVWVTVPEKDVIDLAYVVNGNTDFVLALNGEYSYLENNQSKKYKLNTDTTRFFGSTPLPIVETEKPTVTTEVAKVDELQKTEVTAQSKMEETLTKKEGDVNYFVQIGAFINSKVGIDNLKKRFSITESIKSEMQGGFSKFMVGNHNEYKDARDHREIIKVTNKVKSAFVVAYNSGKRITVQEALMISNQKWFK